MLEELMNLIKEHGQEAVVNNTAIPNEHNEAVLGEAGNSIMSGIQNMISSGNMQQITGMLQGGNSEGASQITSNFASTIAQKFGIDPAAAQNVAGSLIPNVLSSFTSKLQNNAGGLDLQNILGSFTSSGAGGLGGVLGQLGSKFRLDKDNDGDVDLGDLTKMFNHN